MRISTSLRALRYTRAVGPVTGMAGSVDAAGDPTGARMPP
jgi:hypothetical protein